MSGSPYTPARLFHSQVHSDPLRTKPSEGSPSPPPGELFLRHLLGSSLTSFQPRGCHPFNSVTPSRHTSPPSSALSWHFIHITSLVPSAVCLPTPSQLNAHSESARFPSQADPDEQASADCTRSASDPELCQQLGRIPGGTVFGASLLPGSQGGAAPRAQSPALDARGWGDGGGGGRSGSEAVQLLGSILHTQPDQCLPLRLWKPPTASFDHRNPD